MTILKFDQVAIYFIALSAFLFLVNIILKRSAFCLDAKSANDQKHKNLLNEERIAIPLSGSLYFFAVFVIILLFFNFDISVIFPATFFLLLGFCSDVNFLNSPKIRIVIQALFIAICIMLNPSLNLEIRITIIDNLLHYELFRVFFIAFLLLTLANGYNFIDGTNLLASLNFLVISIFLFLININFSENPYNEFLFFLIISLSVFALFNFFGKNFLGDGGTYGLSIFFGLYIILAIPNIKSISPYFVANLLFYPAFENLFTILRRVVCKIKSFSPDNDHLHHLLFRYFKNKNFLQKNYARSSMVGIVINSYFFLSTFLAYNFISKTIVQIAIIATSILFYLFFYFLLRNFLNKKISEIL